MKKRTQSEGSLLVLGKYLSLTLTLPASVAAGYILGTAADHWLHIPFLRAVGILLGMGAGLTQIITELNRETKMDRNR